MAKPTSFSSLQQFITFVDEKYGSKASLYIPEAIPTGSLSLDMSIGIGGVPKGRITQVWGQKGSAKTTLALSIAKQALKVDERAVLYVDMEYAMTVEFAKSVFGDELSQEVYEVDDKGKVLNDGRFIIRRYSSLDEALKVCLSAIENNLFSLIIFDSLGSSENEEEGEKDIDEKTYANYAGVMTKFIKKATKRTGDFDTAFVVINQVRQNMRSDSAWNPYRFPGGEALYHAVSLDIRMTPNDAKSGRIMGQTEEEIIGKTVNFTILHNKLSPPSRNGTIPILFGRGVDSLRDILDFTKRVGVTYNRGAYYYFQETQDSEPINLGQGSDNAIQYLEDNPEVLDNIIKKCYTLFITNKKDENADSN